LVQRRVGWIEVEDDDVAAEAANLLSASTPMRLEPAVM
jgi:hypothetical protein